MAYHSFTCWYLFGRMGYARIDIEFRKIAINTVDHLLPKRRIQRHIYRRDSWRQSAQPKGFHGAWLTVLHQQVAQCGSGSALLLHSKANMERLTAFDGQQLKSTCL